MSRDRIIQLQECAEGLGFSTITEALDAGYHEVQDLVAGTFTLEKIDEQEKAHEAWLKERDDILDDLEHLKNIYKEVKPDEDIIERTINFVKKGEC